MKKILQILIMLAIIFWGGRVHAPTAVTNIPEFPDPPNTTTILMVGDIMLSRNVGAKIEEAKNPNLPFLNLQDSLKNADITFGNLECPLSDSQIPLKEGLVFRCLTRHFDGVVNAGFDVLSTANNHTFDQGEDNIDFTIDYLKSKNILSVGTFKSDGSAILPVIKKNDILFGFLAYSYTARNDGGKSTSQQIADFNDIQKMRQDIFALKGHNADVVIVSMHAGTEYTRHPNQQQIDFAHAAIDAGADVVIGHHPHWVQDIETYKDKPIFYSLGNFVFDQMWSQETREGLAVKLNFQGVELKSYELLPVIIDNYCCPRLANDNEKKTILKKIDQTADILEIRNIQD